VREEGGGKLRMMNGGRMIREYWSRDSERKKAMISAHAEDH